MSDYRLVIQPEADADIESAYLWYESDRAGLGMAFLEAVESAFGKILRSPESYAVTSRGCRNFAVKRFPYIVHYLVAHDVVSIIAVVHARRHPHVWQGRVDDLT